MPPPDSPVVILPAASGSSPSSPVAILAAASGGSPSSPVAILAAAAADAGLPSFDFTDGSAPSRDGKYQYIGLTGDGGPVWARDDSAVGLLEGFIVGAGWAWVQEDLGSGSYVWRLKYGTAWSFDMPTHHLTSDPGVPSRATEPDPTAPGGYYDDVALAEATGYTFGPVSEGKVPPGAVLP